MQNPLFLFTKAKLTIIINQSMFNTRMIRMKNTVSPKLSCYLALYSDHVAHPVVRDVYEPHAIAAMHPVLSFQYSLKYDERHSDLL